ncbi:serine/threonine-protein kinase [Candidatus Uabimicrobium sp. HlEnr_7]|uniref:serine/threonine-protein kinase n=1 Tax=Candidatus Uabimicrobium helgolandensis TaxID=3095367 RepID=UPI003558660E
MKNIQTRNKNLAYCAYLLGISIPKIQKINNNESLDEQLLQSSAISQEQQQELHMMYVYVCLLQEAKKSNYLNDFQIENLIRCKISSRSQEIFNDVERQLIPIDSWESIVVNASKKNVFTLTEMRLAKSWINSNSSIKNSTQIQNFHSIGKYKIINKIGEGGMGAVFEAFHPELQKKFAIKVLQGSGINRKRFFAEAQITAKLKHPNIVNVYDVGSEGSVDYIVMELIKGKPLDDYLKETRFTIKKSSKIMIEILSAMYFSHNEGVIHRDLKPGNLMIEDGSDRLIVMDFGLAKNIESEKNITRTGAVIGTPRYMSPEQASGHNKQIDALTDIYALGTIYYEMLSGKFAVEGKNYSQVINNVINNNILPLREKMTRAPRALEAICRKATIKDCSKRYQTAQDMSLDIQNFLDGKNVSARNSYLPYHITKNLKLYMIGLFIMLIVLNSIVLGVYIGKSKPLQEPEVKKSVNKELAENNDKKFAEMTLESAQNEKWRVVRNAKYSIKYHIHDNWPVERVYANEPSLFCISHEKRGKPGSIIFYFKKDFGGDFQKSITDFENQLWRGKIVIRKMEKKHRINSLAGKKVLYNLNHQFQVETFFWVHNNNFCGAAVFAINAKPQILEEFRPALQSIKVLPVTKNEYILVKNSKFGIDYNVNKAWRSQTVNSNGYNIKYFSPENETISFHFLHASGSLQEWMKRKESATVVEKSGRHTLQGVKGIIIRSLLIKDGRKFHRRSFYALQNNIFYHIYHTGPSSSDNHNRRFFFRLLGNVKFH